MSVPQGSNKRDRTSAPRRAATRRRKSPVLDGAAILDSVEDVARRHLVLPTEHSFVALTLWIAATHRVPSWQHAPRLAIVSPKKQSGKTRVLEVVEALCHSPIKTANATPAALFRMVTRNPPTILVDEADAVFGQAKAGSPNAEDLRAFYNAGFQRGELTYRVMPDQTVGSFNTFAMVALCSIKDLPDTIMDRSIVLRMRRRAKSQRVEPWESAHREKYRPVYDRIVEWSAATKVAETQPDSPLSDRPADVWRPLLIVADLAGGGWPERARIAAKEMVEAESGSGVASDDLRLLSDIRDVWPADEPRIHSSVLCQRLNIDRDLGWCRHVRGAELGPVDLAAMLQPYEIHPKQLKVAGKNGRGYHRYDFDATWRSYLDADE